MTHASENITLPQTSFAGGKYDERPTCSGLLYGELFAALARIPIFRALGATIAGGVGCLWYGG